MFKHLFLALLLLPISTFLYADANGVIGVKSKHSVEQTADRLERILASKGMKIFQRINHATGAKSVGIALRPTELIIFGNPKAGSPLMQCTQTIAIDLPQKALIWEDANGQVWISYNDPAYLKQRHQMDDCDATLTKVSNALKNLTSAAAK